MEVDVTNGWMSLGIILWLPWSPGSLFSIDEKILMGLI